MALAVVHPDAAHGTSCASTVVVEGRLLWGHGGFADRFGRPTLARRAGLPRRTGLERAVVPPCGEGHDQWIRVQTLDGLPADVAVVDARVERLFLAEGSLVASAAHPLHRLLFAAEDEPTYRRRHRCRPFRTPLRGIVIAPGASVVRARGRRVLISVDARTRMTNRPAYQPILPTQRVRLRTSRCGPRRVADRITFLGPTVQAERYDIGAARSRLAWIGGGILLAVCGIAAGVVLAARRARRRAIPGR